MKSQDELRKEIKKKLLEQSRQDRDDKSRLIIEKVTALPIFLKAKTLYCFVSMPQEVDTELLIDRAFSQGKHVIVPKADLANKQLHWYEIRSRSRDLREGVLGIHEPNPHTARLFSGEPDCIFVPGVVFDKKNNRIGRGAGFYDRYLSTIPPYVRKIGLAFSFQVVSEFPLNPHDVGLDEVITD